MNRTPLTAEQIQNLWLYRKNLHGGDLMAQLQDFARAVEATHGITALFDDDNAALMNERDVRAMGGAK